MRISFVLFCLFGLFTSGFAQKIETDHAAFFKSDGSFLWEFYYSISNNQLSYQHSSGDNYNTQMDCKLLLLSGSDTIVNEKWNISDLRSVSDSTIRDLIGQKRYNLNAGNYKVYFGYSDVFGENQLKHKTFSFELKSQDRNVVIGDIQLARNIIKSDDINSFTKFGYYIVPNPEAVFATNQIEMYLCHSYKVLAQENDDSKYSLRYKLLDAAKMPVRKQLQYVEIENESNTYFTYFNTSLSGLPSGVYYAVVEIYKDQYLFESKEKKFFMYNYEMPLDATIIFTEDQIFEMSEFATMTDEQVDLNIKMSNIVANEPEKELFVRLTSVKGKQRALYRFWKMRDRDTSTLTNETLIEFQRRIKYANRHFSSNTDDNGWNTDRGWVLIKYGFPDDKDIHPLSMDNNAWEEWHYTRYEGGALFYFVERLGYNDYQLVHSTVTGEAYNPDWYDKYVPTDNRAKSTYELENDK